jgi:predicted alpha/beta hydrolase
MNLDPGSNAFGVREQSIHFKDQTRTSITVYGNKSSSIEPLFLILPALGVRASYYEMLARTIAHAGFHAVTMDWRGTGKSSVQVSRKTRFGYHEILTTELPEIIQCIKRSYPGHPIYLFGHSLGGQIGLLYASLNPQTFSGAVLVAAGSNYYKNLNIPRRFGRYVNLNLIRWITFLCGYFPGDKLGFAGKESKPMILDWLHEAMTGRYSIRNSSRDYETLLTRIDIRILFITLVDDVMVTAKCAQYLAAKLATARVSRVELNMTDDQFKKINHFNWAKKPAPVMETILKWL